MERKIHNNEIVDIAPLDPLSDRYRVCPHPQCGKAHMVNNRGKDYCSNKCANDHYNMLRRLKKQALESEAARLLVQEKPQLFTETQPETTYAPEVQTAPAELEKNYRILSQLHLDNNAGSLYTLSQINDLGLDLRFYSGIKRHHNLPKNLSCNWLYIGPFRIYRLESEKFLLIKKT